MPRQHSDTLIKAEKQLHDQINILPKPQLISCLGIVSLAALLSFIDQHGILIALPTVAADLDARDTISWTGTSSLLANTAFQMLYGRLSDISGRKSIFITALLLLAIAQLVCGFSNGPAMFYVFRGLAGIGIGGITNLINIIISDVVTLDQRGKYQGPFLVAAFISRATWRWYFWTLAPIGEGVKKIDYLGTLTLSTGTIFLLIPISGGGAYFPWDSPMVISMLAIGLVSMFLLVIVEWKAADLPMIPYLFFLLGFVYQSMIYYVPIYLQNARRFALIKSATVFVPLVGIQAIMSILSGLWITRFKLYAVVIRFGFGIWTL
ncbi:hypothetical protein LCI18_007788 [Fusarium solani-melongenae]|uniref:Uncharacterized protein n=1 Tax=Fusarium solani subsp. cucurbitae TaxID=2747967 RepID=A0ACD3Z709_FUSSC|nr:hypothetical protein LCI18_007788 [Fusarium solani-melongenae]